MNSCHTLGSSLQCFNHAQCLIRLVRQHEVTGDLQERRIALLHDPG
ncbi:hypothetical protein [Streptomyces lunaelactis]|nr:hypothetical protein [Streptomyces lunaelactis]